MMFPIMRLLPLEETHLKLGYEASPRNCGHCSTGNARPIGLPPALCGSITYYSPFCSPLSSYSGLLDVLLHPGPFPVFALPGMPFLDRISVAHSRAPFSPLLKQHLLSGPPSMSCPLLVLTLVTTQENRGSWAGGVGGSCLG